MRHAISIYSSRIACSTTSVATSSEIAIAIRCLIDGWYVAPRPVKRAMYTAYIQPSVAAWWDYKKMGPT
jgi:hypothetical protein